VKKWWQSPKKRPDLRSSREVVLLALRVGPAAHEILSNIYPLLEELRAEDLEDLNFFVAAAWLWNVINSAKHDPQIDIDAFLSGLQDAINEIDERLGHAALDCDNYYANCQERFRAAGAEPNLQLWLGNWVIHNALRHAPTEEEQPLCVAFGQLAMGRRLEDILPVR